MAEILKGNVVATQIKEKMKKDIEELAKHSKVPTLAIVRLGDNPGDISYEKSIIKNCDKIGIESKVFERDAEIKTEELIKLIEDLNEDDNISGILVFRPLPKHIDEEIIRNTISPLKDVDCMHPLNLERIFEGDMDGFAPCTPKAAMEILKHYDINTFLIENNLISLSCSDASYAFLKYVFTPVRQESNNLLNQSM